MIRKVIKLNGRIINVGPWEYNYQPRPIFASGDETLLTGKDNFGNDLFRKAVRGEVIGYNMNDYIAMNPLPEGAEEAEAELVEGADGGLYEASDYRSLRGAAYPSFKDQLDMLFHDSLDNGTRFSDAISSVKAKYPKVK